MAYKEINIEPLQEMLTEYISPQDLAEQINGIIYRYTYAVIENEKSNCSGISNEIYDDLCYMRMLYERLLEVCKKNNICR